MPLAITDLDIIDTQPNTIAAIENDVENTLSLCVLPYFGWTLDAGELLPCPVSFSNRAGPKPISRSGFPLITKGMVGRADFLLGRAFRPYRRVFSSEGTLFRFCLCVFGFDLDIQHGTLF